MHRLSNNESSLFLLCKTRYAECSSFQAEKPFLLHLYNTGHEMPSTITAAYVVIGVQ
jgi:hypothetical protein